MCNKETTTNMEQQPTSTSTYTFGRPRKLTWDTPNLTQYQIYYLRARDKKNNKASSNENTKLSLDDQNLTQSQRKSLQYRTNNPDKIKQWNNEWKKNNPEKVREYNRQYAAKNRYKIGNRPPMFIAETSEMNTNHHLP
jgi:hypothetical protein